MAYIIGKSKPSLLVVFKFALMKWFSCLDMKVDIFNP